MANTFELIQSYTVGSGGAASIDFTTIPSTYTDLCVKWSLREANDYMGLSFNGSTANFTSRFIFGGGSGTPSSNSRTDNYQSATVVTTSWTASTFSNAELYIPNYAGNTNKSFSIDTVTENNSTTAYMELIAGLWSNTAAINRVTLNSVGSFVQYSTAYLYGVKNA